MRPTLLLHNTPDAHVFLRMAAEAGVPCRIQAVMQEGLVRRCLPDEPAMGTVALDGSDWQEGAPVRHFLLHAPVGQPWARNRGVFETPARFCIWIATVMREAPSWGLRMPEGVSWHTNPQAPWAPPVVEFQDAMVQVSAA